MQNSHGGISFRYNGMLSFYYLLTVRFGVRREVFSQRYEFWMHSTAIVYFLSTAIIGLAFGMYSELEYVFLKLH